MDQREKLDRLEVLGQRTFSLSPFKAFQPHLVDQDDGLQADAGRPLEAIPRGQSQGCRVVLEPVEEPYVYP